jgi:hypothetical protein
MTKRKAPQIRKATLNGGVLLGVRQRDIFQGDQSREFIWMLTWWLLDLPPTTYILRGNEIIDLFPAENARAVHPSAGWWRADTLTPEISAFILKTVAGWEREAIT